ncbi:hypothetical protein KAW11_02110 [Candidatus Bathyarchaeota archaeon]|nr:hypothetical protein [Candidatus Bathyarchaeota archaeon]
MAYFNTRDITAIIMCAALWAVLNNTLSPVFWRMTHMPFLCDFLAFTSLILVAWWTRKFGAISLTGFIVTLLTFALRGGSHMLGFMAASILFDILTRTIGYSNCFEKPLSSTISMISFSTICAGTAGLIIGTVFMNLNPIWTVITFAANHAIGGIIGGIFGLILVNALKTRITIPSHPKQTARSKLP